MGDKIAYQPIKDEGADVEDATPSSPPQWTIPTTHRWPTQWMRVVFEVVLVAVVFFLSLKIMLDGRVSTNSGYRGPNDPKKDCTPFGLQIHTSTFRLILVQSVLLTQSS